MRQVNVALDIYSIIICFILIISIYLNGKWKETHRLLIVIVMVT